MIDTEKLNDSAYLVWEWKPGQAARSLTERMALACCARWIYDLFYNEKEEHSRLDALKEVQEHLRISRRDANQYVDLAGEMYLIRNSSEKLGKFRPKYQEFVNTYMR